MAASFDGTAATLETPFDGVTVETHSITAAIKSHVAQERTTWDTSNIVSGDTLAASNVRGTGHFLVEQIPWEGQRTTWDTSNIVSGDTLTPGNVGGTGQFRVDQIPWSSGAPTMWPSIIPFMNTASDSPLHHIAASNVYGGLSNAYLDVTRLFGTAPINATLLPTSPNYVNVGVSSTLTASNVEAQRLHGALDYSYLENTPTSLTQFANNGTDKYAHLSDVAAQITLTLPWSDLPVFQQTYECVDVNQPKYSYSNFTKDEWIFNATIEGWTPLFTTAKLGIETANHTDVSGHANMASYKVHPTFEVLPGTGVYASNLAGQLSYTTLPAFLQPTITYDVKPRTHVTTLTGRTLTTQAAIVAELRVEFPGLTDDELCTALGITDLMYIKSMQAETTTDTTTESSNMRFSLTGFKSLQSDYIYSSNIVVTGDISATGAIRGHSIVSDGTAISGGGSSGSSGANGGEIAMSVLGMIFGGIGAFTGLKALLGGSGKLPDNVVNNDNRTTNNNYNVTCNVSTNTKQKTLAELIDDNQEIFSSNVNVLVRNYTDSGHFTSNLFKNIIDTLDAANMPFRLHMNEAQRNSLYLAKTNSYMLTDIIERSVKAAGLQLVDNAATTVADVVVEGLELPDRMYILPAGPEGYAPIPDLDPMIPE